MKKYKNKSNLQNIPGVSPRIEKDLQDIGINCINDLRGKRPENLYNKHDPNLLKWWNWKDK